MSVSSRKHIYAKHMSIDDVQVGTKLKVRSLEWWNDHFDMVMLGVYIGPEFSCGSVFTLAMTKFCGHEVTVDRTVANRSGKTEIYVRETGPRVCWDQFMFENFDDFFETYTV